MNAKFIAAPALLAAALFGSACPLGGGNDPRRVGDIIRDADAAMATAQSYQVDGDVSFDVSVLPDIGRVTGHADVVPPDSYVAVKAGPHEARLLTRGGVMYTSNGNQGWKAAGARIASPAEVASPYAKTAALLALEVFGDFESRRSDRAGTELLRYELSINRIFEIEKTMLGIVIPDVKDLIGLADVKGTIDFDFYIDASSHRIDEIVISGDARALGIPVKVSGSIKYRDFDSQDIELPDPGDPPPAASDSLAAHLPEAG